jgi:hypothetical protein
MIQAMVAVRRLRPCDPKLLPTVFRGAVLIAVAALACTACSSEQASRFVAGTDVSCVRSVEAAGGTFPQAVDHCQKNPFNTLSPTMLDLSGAPDLQRQAFASGYYNRDLPASNAAEAARLQALQSGLAAAMAVRQKSQGKSVKALSSTECMADLLDVPHEAFVLGPAWDGNGPSPANQYLTPQENDCLARQREAASSSVAVPVVPVTTSSLATLSAAPEVTTKQQGAAPFHRFGAPSVKESAKSARNSSGAHTDSPRASETDKALIL